MCTWRERLCAHKAGAAQARRQRRAQQVDARGGQARQGRLHAVHLLLIGEAALRREGRRGGPEQ